MSHLVLTIRDERGTYFDTVELTSLRPGALVQADTDKRTTLEAVLRRALAWAKN